MKLLPSRLHPLLLAVIGSALGRTAAERCEAASVVVQCRSRCGGLNSSSWTSTNPPQEQVFAPSGGHGGHALLVEPLAEAPLQGGSPTQPTQPSDTAFSNQTIYAPAHRAFSPDQLMAVVGPASAIEWVRVGAAGFGCVDGRHPHAGLYTYGGDLGEFVLALSVLEHVTDRHIAQAETTRLLEGWLKLLHEDGGKFLSCIDSAAVSQLAAAVGQPADLDIRAAPEEARASLLLRLVAPEFVGSEHVKWMLQYSETYATRRTLVEQVLRSFYGALWNPYHPLRAALDVQILRGQRAERAVVHVHASHWCAEERGLAPTLPSLARAGSTLVVHPQAIAARRDALVRYLCLAASVGGPSVERSEFLARVRTLGDGQAQLTEKAFAGMLRSYSLLFQ
eukprot:CAMPEP_0115848752 /NCGR_PEP_ID=MMETSP0287-20121206/11090_1 /TAXON_ID=412157 /ORGANISM="Chrysochromulina rotalis, Strain UIO044" /LENGTH=392 /DNA_ID=CAMNT_0003302687 /DNA_START=17 /DNA_END=1195 /DNA_ORIENTATION=-